MIKIIGAKKTQRDEEAKKGTSEKLTFQKVSPALIRVTKEIGELVPLEYVKIDFPDKENLMKFNVVVIPPQNSLWFGGKYHFNIELSNEYPHEPPKIHCSTKVYHPNISLQGKVCVPQLRAEWKPVYGIQFMLICLEFLFNNPEPNDPLNQEAGELMRSNHSLFAQTVKNTLKGKTINGETYPRFI